MSSLRRRRGLPLTEARLGLIPATISPYVVSRIGPAATELFATGRRIGTGEAQRIGLVTEIGDGPDGVLSAIAKTSPAASRAAKALARSLLPAISEEAVAASIAQLADVWEHPDAAEGVSAFFERRAPTWT